MYISKITLNPIKKDVQRDLLDIYQMHRTILSFFPDKEDGGPGRVLYRIEEEPRRNSISILITSEKEPDWNSSSLPQDYLIEKYNPKQYLPKMNEGQILSFRLRVNPTVKRDGKRLGLLNEDEQIGWLLRKGKDSGFMPINVRTIPEGFARGRKSKGSNEISLYSVRFEGYLKVTDPKSFEKALKEGIGPAKGLGFGLLSIAPVD